VYDWSLGNATLSSKLAVLIERAVVDDDANKLEELMVCARGFHLYTIVGECTVRRFGSCWVPTDLRFSLESRSQVSVQAQLSSYPSDELHQLPTYCARLGDALMLKQTTSMADKCTNALQLLRGHQRRLLQARHTHTSARDETSRAESGELGVAQLAARSIGHPTSMVRFQPRPRRRSPTRSTRSRARRRRR